MSNEDLLRDLEAASRELKKQVGGKSGDGTEKKYGQAYTRCVRAGIKPILRKKYR